MYNLRNKFINDVKMSYIKKESLNINESLNNMLDEDLEYLSSKHKHSINSSYIIIKDNALTQILTTDEINYLNLFIGGNNLSDNHYIYMFKGIAYDIISDKFYGELNIELLKRHLSPVLNHDILFNAKQIGFNIIDKLKLHLNTKLINKEEIKTYYIEHSDDIISLDNDIFLKDIKKYLDDKEIMKNRLFNRTIKLHDKDLVFSYIEDLDFVQISFENIVIGFDFYTYRYTYQFNEYTLESILLGSIIYDKDLTNALFKFLKEYIDLTKELENLSIHLFES